jgi:hypothetical protein
MGLVSEFAKRLRMIWHRDQLDRDLDEEIRLHLDLRQQQFVDRGFSETTARRAARLKFGNTTHIKEKSQMTWDQKLLKVSCKTSFTAFALFCAVPS